MNNRKARELRKALQLGVPSSMTKEERNRYRLSKTLYNKLGGPDRPGYIRGLVRVTNQIKEMEKKIAEEKEVEEQEIKKEDGTTA